MQSIKLIQKPSVFVPMAADILHHGHINILLKAKKYGKITVGLMTDKGLFSYKKRKPIISYKNRFKILKQIKSIDKIIPLNGLEYVKIAKKFKAFALQVEALVTNPFVLLVTMAVALVIKLPADLENMKFS